MLETLFAARRHHDRVTLLEFELHISTCSWKGRSNCPQSPRSKTTRLLRSRSYTASCWLRTKHQEKTLPVPAEPPCTPFIPRKETGNGLVRASLLTKCYFCRDLQKYKCIQCSFLCTMLSLQKIQCNQAAFKA